MASDEDIPAAAVIEACRLLALPLRVCAWMLDKKYLPPSHVDLVAYPGRGAQTSIEEYKFALKSFIHLRRIQ